MAFLYQRKASNLPWLALFYLDNELMKFQTLFLNKHSSNLLICIFIHSFRFITTVLLSLFRSPLIIENLLASAGLGEICQGGYCHGGNILHGTSAPYTIYLCDIHPGFILYTRSLKCRILWMRSLFVRKLEWTKTSMAHPSSNGSSFKSTAERSFLQLDILRFRKYCTRTFK
jgi:hypothetical protein